jgi:hypothetical protein
MMGKGERARLAALLRHLVEAPDARIILRRAGGYCLSRGGRKLTAVSTETVGSLLTRGLIEKRGPDCYAVSEVARNWIKRLEGGDQPFRTQHDAIAKAPVPGEDREVLTNLDESPIATLARKFAKNGTPFLSRDLVVAAEKLRRDFEIGHLQPRVTANWSASINRGRRTGEPGNIEDLTEMALSARRRVDRAIEAVGPELSGVLIDVCCFLKGLETVERERQWPARSAKLVLRIALQALARNYGLTASATGPTDGRGKVRNWGAEDFRPVIT